MQVRGGYTNKLLRIDLSNRRFTVEDLDEQLLDAFIGGRGLGAKLLYDEVPATTDPLSETNKIILSSGPLTGTRFPTSARTIIVTRSPLTGGYLYTMAGSKFGVNLKKSGFDCAVLEGKSETPVYLVIKDGIVEFKDAGFLSGMQTTMTFYYLKTILGGDLSAIGIGPAGENLVKYACVATDDWRQFGRGGAGAVMGSKNVKAIAVGGSGKTGIVSESEFADALKDIYALLKKQPGVSQGFSRYGSGENLELKWSANGILPTRNWSKSTFDQSGEISMINMRDKKGMVVRDQGCFGCPLQCGKLTRTVSEEFPGYFCDGPEYENLYALGSNLFIGDPNFVVAANMMCDEYGLDTMSTGVTLSWAMESIEKGLLNPGDFGGKPIAFGKTDNLLDLIEDITYKRRLGALLCEGTKRASQRIGKGSDKFAMNVKGMELGGYDARSAKGQAVVFACGNRGGCHHSIGLSAVKEVNLGIGPDIAGKGKLVREGARVRILNDSFTDCTFAFSRSFDYEIWSRALHAVTGLEYDPDKLRLIGDRINTIERLYNLRVGFTVADDVLPRRLMEDRLPDGPNKGQVVTEDELKTMRSEYFSALGWDQNGVPTKEALAGLGL